MKSQPHGKTIRICWHHGEIPNLIAALGEDPATVLPASKWLANVFGWVAAIQYDHSGHARRAELIREHLMPDDRSVRVAQGHRPFALKPLTMLPSTLECSLDAAHQFAPDKLATICPHDGAPLLVRYPPFVLDRARVAERPWTMWR
ncbi:MAG: hypothetical protein ACREM8_12790, partial [Vulcanimicrobiaceae bacterium]